jgi:hypothetical protein
MTTRARLPNRRQTSTAPNPARIRQRAGRLHDLGPRPVAELLLEVAAGADLWKRLERFCLLDPNVVRALGADRMPPRVMLVSNRDRAVVPFPCIGRRQNGC